MTIRLGRQIPNFFSYGAATLLTVVLDGHHARRDVPEAIGGRDCERVRTPKVYLDRAGDLSFVLAQSLARRTTAASVCRRVGLGFACG